ncbi:MAG: hypothetical protein JSW55_02860 [Chloroflexota bacterium]|nr:MAG: hypothetical protein JSW55_02860 [Chloroflexota bacterium]
MLESDNNWKTKILIGSTVIGALSGLAAGFLLSRTSDEQGGGPPKIKTSDALRLAVGVIGLVRGIAALGDPD